MRQLRPAESRGHFDFGWLKTFHSFSFGEYRDPEHMHFRALRVINQDTVKPHQGFPTHSHQDMEILTYVLKGAVTHEDSMGNQSVIQAGEIQRMTAGSGVTHSEYNLADELLEFLQIWIIPAKKNLTPGYQQIKYSLSHNSLSLIAAPSAQPNAVLIHQDCLVFTGDLSPHETLDYVATDRHFWLQVISGELKLENPEQLLRQGDGIGISEEAQLKLTANLPNTRFLLFDLA